jgi:hypothetical protein
MFDYQAGERYRMTLIMVGLVGLMAGIFISFLLMPAPAPATSRRVHQPYMDNPDITGGTATRGPRVDNRVVEAMQSASNSLNGTPGANTLQTDPASAKDLIDQWLPLAWDLSAGSAKVSQEKAISYMSPEVAAAYRQNVWSADVAKQIDESGVKSSFQPVKVLAGPPMGDGTVIVFVEGVQTLSVAGKGQSTRNVKLEYMVKLGKDGMRIVGISEGGKAS